MLSSSLFILLMNFHHLMSFNSTGTSVMCVQQLGHERLQCLEMKIKMYTLLHQMFPVSKRMFGASYIFYRRCKVHVANK